MQLWLETHKFCTLAYLKWFLASTNNKWKCLTLLKYDSLPFNPSLSSFVLILVRTLVLVLIYKTAVEKRDTLNFSLAASAASWTEHLSDYPLHFLAPDALWCYGSPPQDGLVHCKRNCKGECEGHQMHCTVDYLSMRTLSV